jgi:hypothetical protein
VAPIAGPPKKLETAEKYGGALLSLRSDLFNDPESR